MALCACCWSIPTYTYLLDKKGAAEPSGSRGDLHVQLKLLQDLPSLSACVKATHPTQPALAVGSPTKADPSPPSSLIPRCDQHTDTPLLPADVGLAAAVGAASQKGDRDTRVLFLGLLAALKTSCVIKRRNCVFHHRACPAAGVVPAATVSGRLGRGGKGACTLRGIRCQSLHRSSQTTRRADAPREPHLCAKAPVSRKQFFPEELLNQRKIFRYLERQPLPCRARHYRESSPSMAWLLEAGRFLKQ